MKNKKSLEQKARYWAKKADLVATKPQSQIDWNHSFDDYGKFRLIDYNGNYIAKYDFTPEEVIEISKNYSKQFPGYSGLCNEIDKKEIPHYGIWIEKQKCFMSFMDGRIFHTTNINVAKEYLKNWQDGFDGLSIKEIGE